MTRRLLALPLVALAVGCIAASGPNGQSPLASTSAPIAWATPFVGTPPREVSVFRTYPGIDATEVEYPRLHRRSAAERVVILATTSCRQVDL
jgi:hypothetical protein